MDLTLLSAWDLHSEEKILNPTDFRGNHYDTFWSEGPSWGMICTMPLNILDGEKYSGWSKETVWRECMRTVLRGLIQSYLNQKSPHRLLLIWKKDISHHIYVIWFQKPETPIPESGKWAIFSQNNRKTNKKMLGERWYIQMRIG